MKKYFAFAAMIAIAASCTMSEIDSIESTTAPDITASFEKGLTKTTLTTDDDGVGTIWWKPADQINIFYGTTSTKYTSTNTEDATTVVFSTTDVIGSTESASTNRWGLYPYDATATCNGSSVTTTIPTNQHGVAGTFDNDLFTSLAHSENNMMTFYNVCGGIKFSLSREDIQSITFKGNNNENIAGKVSLSMDGNDKPAVEIVSGEKVITLTPKTGATFAKNINYYIVLLPTVLSNGFTITFETETKIGTFEYNTKAVEIKRSVFGKKENVDSYAEFEDKTIKSKYVDLGLSVKWATCNLGATKPEENGDYYAWAEIMAHYNAGCAQLTSPEWKTGLEGYSETTYKWGQYQQLTKYNSLSGSGPIIDNKTQIELEDDAAHIILGGNWRMPTEKELLELFKNCSSKWTSVGEVKGRLFTSKINGAEIFLPAAGYRHDKELLYLGSQCRYWTSSQSPEGMYSGWYYRGSSSGDAEEYESRCYGLTIRPVFDK